MSKYRIEYVDHGGNVRGAQETEHDDDEAAIMHAHRTHARSIGAGFDIWEGERLVHRHRE